jgi:hypothetical protein
MRNVPEIVLRGVVDALKPYHPNLTGDALITWLGSATGGKKESGPPTRKLLSQKETEQYLGCSYWTVRRLCESGFLRKAGISRRNQFSIEDLDACLKRSKRLAGKRDTP